MLRNCGSAENGVRIRLRTTGFSKPSAPCWIAEEDLGHASVGELADDRVAAVRRHCAPAKVASPRPPDGAPTASGSTTATTTRAAREHVTSPRDAGRAAGRDGRGADETAAPPPDEPARRARRCCRAAIGRARPAGGAAPTWCWRTAPRASASTARCRAICRSATTACCRAAAASRRCSSSAPGHCHPARRSAHLGLGGAGLRRALARRAGASATSPTWRASAAGRASLGARRDHGEPDDGGDAGAAHRAVALLPEQPALPQPAVPAHRGRAGLGARWADLRARLANAGRALNRERRIDRDAIFALKMEALEAIFAPLRRRRRLRPLLGRAGRRR